MIIHCKFRPEYFFRKKNIMTHDYLTLNLVLSEKRIILIIYFTENNYNLIYICAYYTGNPRTEGRCSHTSYKNILIILNIWYY